MPQKDRSNMDYITRRLEFDAAHRVLGHPGKCQHLHGHRYVAEVSLYAPQLDSLGMMFDFGIIKTLIGGWIDEFWDHNILLHPDDPLAVLYHMRDLTISHSRNVRGKDVFGDKAPFLMPSHAANPTAENIARVLWETSVMLLTCHSEDSGVRGPILHNVRVYETPNCSADYGTSNQ